MNIKWLYFCIRIFLIVGLITAVMSFINRNVANILFNSFLALGFTTCVIMEVLLIKKPDKCKDGHQSIERTNTGNHICQFPNEASYSNSIDKGYSYSQRGKYSISFHDMFAPFIDGVSTIKRILYYVKKGANKN